MCVCVYIYIYMYMCVCVYVYVCVCVCVYTNICIYYVYFVTKTGFRYDFATKPGLCDNLTVHEKLTACPRNSAAWRQLQQKLLFPVCEV